jgi:hypothetical protein
LEPVFSESPNYPIQGTVYATSEGVTPTPYNGTGFSMECWYGLKDSGVYIKNISVDGFGSFSDTVVHDSQYDFYTLYWGGSTELGGDSLQVGFNVISGIVVVWDLPSRMYLNVSETLSGNVYSSNNQSYALTGSNATITLTGPGGFSEVLFTGQLGPTGSFSIPNYVIDAGNSTGDYAIQVEITDFYRNYGFQPVPTPWIETTTLRVREQTVLSDFPWQLVVIGVVGAAVIVGIIFLQRWLMKQRIAKDRKQLAADIEGRLRNVEMLYRQGRVKEALAYLYVTYTEIALFKHGIEKQASQTTTEFAIIMVKQFGQNPQNIYPFIQEIEQVVYGGYPFNDQIFMHAIGLFGRIYLELMERPLPEFHLS